MSFRCQKCGEVQPTGIRPHRIVTEIREHKYDTGYETVTELSTCGVCATELEDVAVRHKKERMPHLSVELTSTLAEVAGVE